MIKAEARAGGNGEKGGGTGRRGGGQTNVWGSKYHYTQKDCRTELSIFFDFFLVIPALRLPNRIVSGINIVSERSLSRGSKNP